MTNSGSDFVAQKDRLAREWSSQPSPQARMDYYAREIAPLWFPVFGDIPFPELPEEFSTECDTLISLVGVSWQPTGLMAARLRPQRVVLIATESSQNMTADGQGVKSLLHRFTGIPVDRIDLVTARMPVELDVYEAVRDCRERHPNARIFIDITGGLKSMASAVALAGFLYGLPIVYIDSEERDPGTGMPVLGTEYPRLLHNPLEVLGELEFRGIERAFNAGRFQDAAIRASELKQRLLDTNKAETYRYLAEIYGAWDRFEFKTALDRLADLKKFAERFRPHRIGDAAVAVLARLVDQSLAHQMIIGPLADAANAITWKDGRWLIVNHLAAAERRLQHGDNSAALLLIYATVERCVALSLKLNHEVDASNVDWDSDPLSGLKDAYLRNFEKLSGEKVVAHFPRKLSYASGIALNAALGSDLVNIGEDAGWLYGLGIERNHCEFEHGLVPRPVDESRTRDKLRRVKDLVRQVPEMSELDELLAQCTFPVLGDQM